MSDQPVSKSTLITAVIPTYRRPALLKRAVDSVLSQGESSLCVCVFDNASNDETSDVIRALASSDSRVNYYRHDHNIGAAANFEFGLRSVTTPFFSILSDDDYLLPGFYSHAVKDLGENPDAMFWAGTTLNVDPRGTIWDARLDRWPRTGVFTPPDGMMQMVHGMAPTWTGVLFRREILELIGLPDKAALGPSDLDFTLKAAAYPFFMRKHPSAVFSINPSSFSATQPLSSFWPGWQRIFLNVQSNNRLDADLRRVILFELNKDARRMLLRRGMNAVSEARYDFALDALVALRSEYGLSAQHLLLFLAMFACKNAPVFHWLYSRLYKFAESQIVKSRVNLQLRFGHLIRNEY